MQRTTTIVGVLGVALAATTFLALGGMLDLITGQQEAYAPSSRRGAMKVLLHEDSLVQEMYPYHSAAMIVPCDDVELLQAAYDEMKNLRELNAV